MRHATHIFSGVVVAGLGLAFVPLLHAHHCVRKGDMTYEYVSYIQEKARPARMIGFPDAALETKFRVVEWYI
jgi:hypothetical protein